MDKIFSALSDGTRRHLLDALFLKNGQTITELSRNLDMTRQAVTKHLNILEHADLVLPVWKGREKFYYINPMPLSLIYERWINKFERPRIEGLNQLKKTLETKKQEEKMKGFMYQIVIATTPSQVWEALTQPEFTQQFWFGRKVISDWTVGSDVAVITPEGQVEAKGKVIAFDLNQKLSYTWQSDMDNDEAISTVVFELQAMGPLTKLTILHDLDAEDAKFNQAAAGWTFILNGLKTFLETGKPMPSLPWGK